MTQNASQRIAFRYQRPVCRREFFHGLSAGLGTVALNTLLRESLAAEQQNPPEAKRPMRPARATACIFLFMEGGPSHIDTFDPKPKLKEMDGEEFVREGRLVSNMAGGKRYFVPSTFKFAQHGQSGLSICEYLPHMTRVADDLCIYRGLQVESVNHPEACLQMNTGSRFGGEPSMGSWITYGLGTENRDLPAFVVLGDTAPQGGPANWTNAYLPAQLQGTPLRSGRTPILDLLPRPGVTPESQRRMLDTLKKLDAPYQQDHPLQSKLQARLDSYELAFRMQSSVPDVVKIDNEPEHIRKLYGIDQKETNDFGRKCLLARKFIEAGTRFVQCIHGGWDAHDEIARNHSKNLTEVDRPIAGLIADLKQRGLLDSTLIVWCGEFGRSPDNGLRGGKVVAGRDHNPEAMSVVLAGGGVKGGRYVGATDEVGAKAVQCVHPLRDFHVTLLRLLGLDDNRLTYFHSGRFKQLSQVGGQFIPELCV
jgi:hypothetical protein